MKDEWLGRHAASIGRMRNTCNILVGKSEETIGDSLGAKDTLILLKLKTSRV
jgi:hypothetical protein